MLAAKSDYDAPPALPAGVVPSRTQPIPDEANPCVARMPSWGQWRANSLRLLLTVVGSKTMKTAWVLVGMVSSPVVWANGAAVREVDSLSGIVTPFVPNRVTVVREDLRVIMPEIPIPGTDRHGGISRPGPARVRAEYAIRNDGEQIQALPIRFPAQEVVGPNTGDPEAKWQQPAAKLDGRALAVSVQWVHHEMWTLYNRLTESGRVTWAELRERFRSEEEKRFAKLCCADRLFLNPRTHQLYSIPEINLFPGLPRSYLGFHITLQPKRTHRLVVQYWQELGRHEPHSYQFTYIMKTARYWEGWGRTYITVRIPRYQADYIAIDPWPYEHRTTAAEHIYNITCGRPTKNLHVAIDPVGNVPFSGA